MALPLICASLFYITSDKSGQGGGDGIWRRLDGWNPKSKLMLAADMCVTYVKYSRHKLVDVIFVKEAGVIDVVITASIDVMSLG